MTEEQHNELLFVELAQQCLAEVLEIERRLVEEVLFNRLPAPSPATDRGATLISNPLKL